MQYAYILNLLLLLVIAWLIHLSRRHDSKTVAILTLFFTVVAATATAVYASSILTILLTLSFVWALINNARLLTKRREIEINVDTVLDGWYTFIAWYLIILVLDYLVIDETLLIVIGILSFLTASITLIFTIYHAIKYRISRDKPLSEKVSPSVSLAIPARNETHAIEETLRKALASDYEKLEVLVIDDCSQDRTPQIIRDLAQNGIRFIEGFPPNDHWLGKNAAYKALSEESSGDYILFAGVDIHMAPDSVNKLASFTVQNNLDMVSVMPQRVGFDFLANFLQTTRYFFQFMIPWEVIPGRAVLSSVWMIRRDALIDLGGFDVVPNMVVPERHVADILAKEHKYRFLVSDGYLGITSRKKTSSQLETATRTIYPSLSNNPILSLLASLALIALFILPFVALVVSSSPNLALVICLMFVLTNVIIYTRFNASTWFIGLFNLPFIILLQAALIQWSMYKYEFSEVRWKDRNICIPVLNPPLKRQRSNPIS